MRVIRNEGVARDAGGTGLAAQWEVGPTQDEHLDVGVVSFDAGAMTPLHVHHVGQVLVVLSGRAVVRAGDETLEAGVGDVVLTPGGEWHVHGATEHGPMTHLTVTTGKSELREGTY
jgi:quercetin dioxygenase-like cupin family protein